MNFKDAHFNTTKMEFSQLKYYIYYDCLFFSLAEHKYIL